MAKRKSFKSYKVFSTALFVVVALVIILIVVVILPYIQKKETTTTELTSGDFKREIVAAMAGDGDLKIHFISVGQADSIFIEFPTGNNMLIDAAEKSSANTVTSYISSLGVSAIDYVMLTHQDADHCGGMATVFDKFVVKNAMRPSTYSNYKNYDLPADFNVGSPESKESFISTSATYYNFLSAIYNEQGCAWAAFNKDIDLSIKATEGEDTYECFLDILTPTASVGNIKYKEANDFSPIMKLSYGTFDIMLTGDAEELVEKELLNYYSSKDLDVDVLKVGHHGSKTSSSDAFIKKIKPENAIISCGTPDPAKQKYCPWQVTLDTLNDNNVAIYRTDLQGNIVLTVKKDGTYSISTQKECNDYGAILTGYSKAA